MRTLGTITTLAIIGIIATTAAAGAKEYNKREGLDPTALAKLQRTLAGTRLEGGLGPNDGTSGDIVNTGCGKLGIGNVAQVRPGQRIDRDIVIRGDIINAPQGCKR